MKRRTRYKGCVKYDEHRSAFMHAWEAFGRPILDRKHNRNGQLIQFRAELETDEVRLEEKINVHASLIRGFRIHIQIHEENPRSQFWNKWQEPPAFEICIRNPPKDLSQRLKKYRELIHAATQHGKLNISFRSRTQLTAAIAYDLLDL